MTMTSDEHEHAAIRQLNTLSEKRSYPTPSERISVAQVHAIMAVAAAISEVASALSAASKSIRSISRNL